MRGILKIHSSWTIQAKRTRTTRQWSIMKIKEAISASSTPNSAVIRRLPASINNLSNTNSCSSSENLQKNPEEKLEILNQNSNTASLVEKVISNSDSASSSENRSINNQPQPSNINQPNREMEINQDPDQKMQNLISLKVIEKEFELGPVVVRFDPGQPVDNFLWGCSSNLKKYNSQPTEQAAVKRNCFRVWFKLDPIDKIDMIVYDSSPLTNGIKITGRVTSGLEILQAVPANKSLNYQTVALKPHQERESKNLRHYSSAPF